MDELQRHRQLSLGQIIAARVQALTQGFSIQIEQALGIEMQVADNQCILVARVPCQRQYHADKVARRGKTPGHMHHRLQQANLVQHLLLTA
ncbi:hypothetical protein D3C85_1144350 [compost metagenome]